MSDSKRQCRHADIRIFDGLRCCLACGEAVFQQTSEAQIANKHEDSGPYLFSSLNHELGQEIRLIVLNSGEESDRLTCEIVHANLNDSPVYEALSYTWANQAGDSSLSQTILCTSTGTSIAITKNCEKALHCLRQRTRKRALWVDAICINQDDLPERNRQIAFMGRIYSEASQVLIYLGPGSRYTDSVADYLNDLDTRPLNIQCVEEFLGSRYFDRVWVLQEIALARLITLIVGTKQIRWTAATVRSLQSQFPLGALALPSALQWHPATELENDFLTVLHKSRYCSATEPKDKVYAVLGLAKAEAIEGLPIDYWLTEEQLCIKVAQFFIDKKHRLDILKHKLNEDVIDWLEDLPSWVPRWGPKLSHVPLPPQFTEEERKIFAEKWFLPPTLENPKQLSRVVKWYASMCEDDHSNPDVVSSTIGWHAWISNRLNPCSNFDFSSDSIDAFSLALFTSFKRNCEFQYSVHENTNKRPTSIKWGYEIPQPTPKFVLRVKAHYLDTITSGLTDDLDSASKSYCQKCITHSTELERPPECRISATNLRSPQRSHQLERTMATQRSVEHFSTTRSVGFLASGEKPGFGDTVWALGDADVPFVLRQVDEHYVLVGQCYLHAVTGQIACECCGEDARMWPFVTQIIDIW